MSYTINILAIYGLRPVSAVMRQLLEQLTAMNMYDVRKDDRTRYGSYSPGAFMLQALDALVAANVRDTIKYAAMSAALAGPCRSASAGGERADLLNAGLNILGDMYKNVLTAADMAAAQQAVKVQDATPTSVIIPPRYGDCTDRNDAKKEPRRRSRVRRRDDAYQD